MSQGQETKYSIRGLMFVNLSTQQEYILESGGQSEEQKIRKCHQYQEQMKNLHLESTVYHDRTEIVQWLSRTESKEGVKEEVYHNYTKEQSLVQVVYYEMVQNREGMPQ